MKLSSKTHYGLMACHILGKNYGDGAVSASVLEHLISVSGKYLEKIMRMLTKRGIVLASRGANGGYYLSRPPFEIKIGDIVRALEDDIKIIECVSTESSCNSCPSRKVWKRLYDGMNDVLDSMTLKEMIDGSI